MKHMIKNYLIILLLGILAGSCEFASRNAGKSETPKTNIEHVFVYENGHDSQLLSCQFLAKDSMEFHLEGKHDGESYKLTGKAVLVQTFDGETIEDEEGNMIFVNEYEAHVGSCILVLRVDNEELKFSAVSWRECGDDADKLPLIRQIMAAKKAS